MSEINGLIERLEKATGPDRELGNAILFACGWVTNEYGPGPSRSTEWVNADPSGIDYLDGDQPNPTASTDAALTLMPKGFCCDTQSVMRGTALFDEPKAWAQVEEISGPLMVNAAAPTLPLAICIAALKAHSAMTTAQRGEK